MSKTKSHNLCNIIFTVCLFLQVESKTHEEICGSSNGRRMFVELGRRGIITAKRGVIHKEMVASSYNHCKLELISCSACVISVKFTFMNLSHTCNFSQDIGATCSCNYVWIYESPYRDISGRQFCGESNDTSLSYRSQTKIISIVFFYGSNYNQAFSLQYTSERNRQFFQGRLSFNEENGTQIISTPFFPVPYLRDLSKEYVIRCRGLEKCKICLIFTDFLIGKMSVIEFLDAKGKRVDVVTGMLFRPDPIISSGPSLIIRFFANGAANKGFKATYTFLSDDVDEDILKPKIQCGGLVDDLGGGIMMVDVVKDSFQYFDCVWIIKPSKHFLHFYKHLSLKVIEVSDFVGKTELSVHKGITSAGLKVEFLCSQVEKQQQHITTISEGFYIRFKGVIRAESKLAIAYSAISYNECIPGTDFVCKNQRCIPIYLQCDGLDHCGDGSDESVSCFEDLKRHRWSHTSNYFFPKSDNYDDLHSVAIIFLVGCFVVGMISLIIALIVLITRINGRARRQREIESHMQVVNELLGDHDASIQEEIIEEDDPPVYEAPPTYDEIGSLKLYKKDGIKRRASLKRACSRCSQRASNMRRGESLHNILSDFPTQSGFQENGAVGTLNDDSASRINTENKQHFFARFANEDFNSLKKMLQISKKRKMCRKTEHARKFFPNFCESELNHCLSDSEISEIASVNSVDLSSRIQRSFSFDGL